MKRACSSASSPGRPRLTSSKGSFDSRATSLKPFAERLDTVAERLDLHARELVVDRLDLQQAGDVRLAFAEPVQEVPIRARMPLMFQVAIFMIAPATGSAARARGKYRLLMTADGMRLSANRVVSPGTGLVTGPGICSLKPVVDDACDRHAENQP